MANNLSPDMPVVKRQFAQKTSAPVKAPKKVVRVKSKAKAKAPKAKAAAPSPQVAPGLTASQLAQMTGAAVSQKYGGAQQQLAAQPARINNWYTQYQQGIQTAKDAQAAAYDNAVKGVANLQSGLDNSSKEQWAGQQGQMATDAANRGTTTDPTLADQVHNASTVRNMLTGSFGAQFLGQGAAQNAYMGNRQATAGQQQVEALGANAQQMQQLKKDKGSFAQTFRQDAIDTASKNYLNNALAAASLGQKAVQNQATIATTQKTKAETMTTTLKNRFLNKYGRLPSTTDPNTPSAKLDQWRLDYAKAHGRLPSTGARPSGSGKDAFGNTKAQRESSNNNWSRSKTLASEIASPTDSVQSLSQLLITKYPTLPPWMAVAAAQQHILGHVGPGNAKRLKQHGVKHGYALHSPAAPTDAGKTDGTGGY